MAAAEWMRYVEHDRKRRPSTIRDYRREIRRDLLPEFGATRRSSSITTTDIDAYRARLVAEGRLSGADDQQAARAAPRDLQARAAGLWAAGETRWPALERQPVSSLRRLRRPRARGGRALAARPSNEQDAAIFTVAAFTGLRLGELRALRWSDVDWLASAWSTSGAHSPTRSGTAEVGAGPLGAARRPGGAGARPPEPARALDGRGRPRLRQPSASRSRTRRCAAASTRRSIAPGLKRIRFHDLRHTFGTIAVQAFPLSDVKAYMGHADIQTTMIYVHHVPRHDAADRLTELLDARPRAKLGARPVHGRGLTRSRGRGNPR